MSSDSWSAGPRNPEPTWDRAEIAQRVVTFLAKGGWALVLVLLFWLGSLIFSDSQSNTFTPAYVPGTGFAEDPAPGDDGSLDCGSHGPVYVGSNDPMGLDGDGDGWGCES